jgi:phosphocarrier protein HPr
MVVQRTVVVSGSEGIHARPAAEIVRTTNQYKCDVRIRCGSQTVDAKSVLSIMKLAIRPGTQIEVEAEGDDAGAAVDALTRLFSPT